MASKNFIQDATADAHGQFAAKAQKAGMSTITFARKKKHAKGVTGKQARLAATLMGMNKNKKKAPVKPLKKVMSPLKMTPPGMDPDAGGY